MAGSSRARTRPVRRALLVSAVALAAALLTLSSALAARPVARAKYEGPINRGSSGNLSLTVARNGRSMTVDGLVVSRCSNGREYDAFVIDRRLTIRRDGSFSGRVGEDLSGAAFTRSSTVAIRGRFRGAGRRSYATGRVRSRNEGEAGTTCDSGSKPFRARLRR